jgi:hypothetical protein
VEQTRDAIFRSQHRSAWQQALSLHLKDSNICQILHEDLHYHSYKIQVAQELSEQDKVSQFKFCNEFLDLVNNNHYTVNTLLMSDEAHFHMSGYVNKQNCHYWAPNNQRELPKHPLHSVKVRVWYAISSTDITGLLFLRECKRSCLTWILHGHGNVSMCVHKFFHFALKYYFTSKTVRCFWCTLYNSGT